ncbi:MAG: protoporphyrinogen oxidase [Chlamydiota bacterium]
MQKKRAIILGAGISGLATAWYLNRTNVPMDITIVEKSDRAGGWLHTDHSKGFHFEKGPRTFKVDKCPHTIQLMAELGMESDVVWSQARPHHRYLWSQGELHRFPTNPFSFMVSPITKGFLRALLMEWKKPQKMGDETVWEFVLRRFNYDVARLFFDPMVVGIFGGDIRKISVRACFPRLKQWEETHGSVTKGMLAHMKEKRKMSPFSEHIPTLPLSAIFSFRAGIEQLPCALVDQIPATIHYNTEVQGIRFEEGRVVVDADGMQVEGDYLFSALPVKQTAKLLKSHAKEVSVEFSRIFSEGIAVINFGYDAKVLPVQGFGYLTPTYAGEDILGVVFDSSVFPEHNRTPQETRLTIKIQETGRAEEDYIQAALKGIRRHLGISQMPKAVSFKRAIDAIPQYGVGHLERIGELKQALRAQLPQLHLVGSYLRGVSVDQCIARAKEAVNEWQAAACTTCARVVGATSL